VFTLRRREETRAALLERAADDPRVTGAAVTGSAADGREDRWSDIDLFLGVADGAGLAKVFGDFTDAAYRELGALHHFDLHAGTAVYRAFLLGDLLEIDLGLAPAADFGPRGEGDFRVVFGEAAPRRASAALLRELHATDPDLARTLAPALTAAASPPETPASPPPAAPDSQSRR
jgi:predicted nucleotidyltransferase